MSESIKPIAQDVEMQATLQAAQEATIQAGQYESTTRHGGLTSVKTMGESGPYDPRLRVTATGSAERVDTYATNEHGTEYHAYEINDELGQRQAVTAVRNGENGAQVHRNTDPRVVRRMMGLIGKDVINKANESKSDKAA